MTVSNNLHRELAPITPEAWAEIEEEAARTFKRWIAGRRVVDVVGPRGPELAAVPTGHQKKMPDAFDGVSLRKREVAPVVELRVPFTVTREAIDDVARGSKDSDWQPVKDAATQIAKVEDSIVFNGYPAGPVHGIMPHSSNEKISIYDDIEDLPEAVSKALAKLRLQGVEGPYALLLPVEMWEQVHEETDDGYPVLKHVDKLLDGNVIWAPALDKALVISTRGGDYELHIGRDLSIGYTSHDAETVTLYLEETITALPYTDEASVIITTS